jgi:hypothetical protein
MFTEQDYRDYFTTLQNAERQMIECSEKILSEISDSDIKDRLNNIHNDELRHLTLEKELFAILDKSSAATN